MGQKKYGGMEMITLTGRTKIVDGLEYQEGVWEIVKVLENKVVRYNVLIREENNVQEL